MSKGNKHADKRIYKKGNWVGSRWWREAQKAKRKYHKPKKEKKDQ